MADALSSPASRLRGALGVLVVLAAGCSSPAPRAPIEPNPNPPAEPVAAPTAPDYRVVVTIDDLPLAMRDDYLNDDERRETVDKLVALLTARGIPFVGFFNMVHDEADPSLTQRWLTAPKMVVGNHTWSHPSAHRTPLDAYLADVRRGHEAVVTLRLAQKAVPFRFPYLNQGFDAPTRDAIFAQLDALGSRHAPVTIDTSDWLYARGYLEAVHRGESDEAERWQQAWLWNIQETTIIAEHLADDLFGRLPPQILLLHGNRLNADHLGQALDWYEQRGYRFIDLDEALSDPAYEEADLSTSPTGDSHWLRLRRSRELERPDVLDEAEPATPPQDPAE